jgi:hypothetical protein
MRGNKLNFFFQILFSTNHFRRLIAVLPVFIPAPIFQTSKDYFMANSMGVAIGRFQKNQSQLLALCLKELNKNLEIKVDL